MTMGMESSWENCQHGRQDGPRRPGKYCDGRRGRPHTKVMMTDGAPVILCLDCVLFKPKTPSADSGATPPRI